MKTKILLKARWLLCGLLAVFLTTNAWADEVTYTFNSKSWGATSGGSPANWTSNKDGLQFNASNNPIGLQINVANSGANGTSPESFDNISKLDVVYNSTGKGVGSISVKIGTNEALSAQSIAKSKTNTTLSFSPATAQTGNVTITGICTTNSFAIVSVTITYSPGGGDEPAATLTELKFAGGSDLSKKTYDSSERIDLTGLSVIGTYSDDTNSDVTNDVTWTVSADGITYVSPEALTLTVGMTQIYVKATLGDESVNTLINGLTVTAALPKSTLIFTAACSGSGTADDNVSWTVTSDGTESTFDSSKGIHYGTGSNAVQYIKLTTSDINGTIKKIVVNASAASGVSATASVKVNGVAFGGDAQNISSDATDYTFTGSAIGAIEVTITKESSATKALYVKSIVVTYETTPFVTVDPASLTFAAKQNIVVEAQQFTLTGANLESGLTLTASEGFNVTPTSLTAEAAMTQGGTAITVTPATPTAATTPVNGMVTISGGGMTSDVVVNLTMNVTATYAVAIAVNDNTMGSATINGGTAAIYVTEDDVITLVATEKPGYEFVNWTVSNENIVLDDENAASTTAMVGAAGTITAYFQSLPCTVLSAPTLDGTVETTYYSATLNWNEVANADGYSVEVKQGDVTKGSDVILAAPLSFTVTGLEANTTYTYTIQSVGDGTAYCAEGGVLAGSFTTADYPTALLTLSENGVERVLTGSYKLNDVVALPTTSEQTCVGKTLVGWSEVAVTATDTKPASQYYDAGADYTFTSVSATLYAVYATGGAGDANEIFAEHFNGCEGTGGNDGSWSGSIASTTLSLTGWTTANGNAADGCAKFGSGSKKGSAETPSILLTGDATLTFKAGAWNGNSEGTTLNISATGASLDKSSVTLTKGAWNTYTVSITSATGSVKIKFEANNASNNRFFLDDVVVYETAVAYSAYTTTCVAALAAPIFSVEGGTYTTAQSIELNAAEGTIYYTLDGTDPTDESTEYTEAIVLDACATTTVKAIAISADNSSEIAEATYVINLGIPANSAAAPYTPAEAIDVYNSGCYNGEEVFVKGVVTTANLQGSGTYAGTCNVYVKGEGTDGSVTFEFYNMYKDGENGTFTEGDIAAGDIILAKGVLSKYNSTYEFASGCEMVEHTPYEASKTSIANTIENPYTVAEAIVFCEDGITYDLSEEVYVRGVVTSINTSNNTIFIHDADAENEFQLFHADLNENEVGVNDIVIAKGTLLKYNATTYEMTEGCLIVDVVKYVSSVTGVTVVETASVKVGKTITLIAEVAPADATNKNVSWESDNTSVATVDENGVVTGVAEGTAHITVTTEDGSFTATATITVEAAPSFTGGEWVLVTDVAQLSINDYIIIANAEYNKAMSSTQNSNNRGDADVTIAGGILTYESAPAIFTLKAGNEGGQYAFYDEDVNGYLFAASSSSNWLRTQETVDANASWTITITDGVASVVAQGTNTHNLMQYNNSSKIFSCYNNDQKAIALYKYYSTPALKLTYDMNGGTGAIANAIANGENQVTITSTIPERVGYNFTGWNTASDGSGIGYTAGNVVTLSANLTLYAQWDDEPVDGEEMVIIVKNGDKYYAMGQVVISGNRMNAVELTDGIIGDKMINVPTEDRAAITWIRKEKNDGFTFQAQNGKYLVGNNSTDLKLGDEPTLWKFDAENGYYYTMLSGTKRTFIQGVVSGTEVFRNYDANLMNTGNYSGASVYLNEYIDIDNTKEIVTLRSGLENGKIGTMCWNADIYEVEGAYFFEPEMKQADGVCFAEAAKEGGVYPMGKPYVFQATGEEIRAVVSKTTTDVAGTNNGLHGVLGETVDINGENYYIIYQNRLYTANNNYIVANRAYIVKSELPGASANPAPNRRRLVIGRDNLPTGIESIVLNAEQVKKVLVDGQIYIVRDGKLYDLTGKVVR